MCKPGKYLAGQLFDLVALLALTHEAIALTVAHVDPYYQKEATCPSHFHKGPRAKLIKYLFSEYMDLVEMFDEGTSTAIDSLEKIVLGRWQPTLGAARQILGKNTPVEFGHFCPGSGVKTT